MPYEYWQKKKQNKKLKKEEEEKKKKKNSKHKHKQMNKQISYSCHFQNHFHSRSVPDISSAIICHLSNLSQPPPSPPDAPPPPTKSTCSWGQLSVTFDDRLGSKQSRQWQPSGCAYIHTFKPHFPPHLNFFYFLHSLQSEQCPSTRQQDIFLFMWHNLILSMTRHQISFLFRWHHLILSTAHQF